MKAVNWRWAAAGAILAGAAATSTALAWPADGSPGGAGGHGSHAALAGTWQVTVEPDAGQPGSPPPFQSLLEYTGGGGTIEETTRGATLTGGLGTWYSLPNGQFAVFVQKYRFDATGAWVATIKIYETEKVSRDGRSYVGHATTKFVSPTGVVQSTFTSTTHGTRLGT